MVDDSQEEWKDIPNYEGIYQASSEGRIRRIADGINTVPGRIRKQTVDSRGYCIIRLCHPVRGIQCHRAHKVIAETFFGVRPLGLTINHIDGVKTNNAPRNLEYVTVGENNRHAMVTGLKKRLLTPKRVEEIQGLRGQMSQRKAAALTGISASTIWHIWNGKTYQFFSE
ncbi:MAG TPA: NUMOD4 domain-containing protein [Gemmataceae bacterium]|nr:NUMOD4 domain-containing protein [Gemmataceae bacterium]